MISNTVPGQVGEPVVYPTGTFLFRQNAPAQTAFLIETGATALVYENGEKRMFAGARIAGHLIGGAAALLGEHHSTTAITLIPSQVRSLPRRDLETTQGCEGAFGLWLSTQLAREAHDLATRALSCASAHGRDRLKAVLADLFDSVAQQRADGSRQLAVPIRTQDLADFVCLTREQTSRILRDLHTEGFISRRRGWFAAPLQSPLSHRSNA